MAKNPRYGSQVCLQAIGMLLPVVMILVACASTPPFHAYTGTEQPQEKTAVFVWVAPSFISYVPYKLDGKPNSQASASKFMEGTFASFTSINSEYVFMPGRHTIEFYAVDTDPVSHFVLGIDLEAGKRYIMKGKTREFSITCDGVPVPYTNSPVPVLEEPKETEPHATLTFLPGKGGFKSVPYILRIDGKVRETMYRLHPRWTTMNYSSLARGIVTSIGGAGMLIHPNLDAKEGYLSIRITPGHHVVEYFTDNIYAGRRMFSRLVRIAEFDALAGVKYSVDIVPDLEKQPDGLLEHGIEIKAE